MTGSVVVRAALGRVPAARAVAPASAMWSAQSLVAWMLVIRQPSVWSVAAATAQLLLEGRLFLRTEATPRWNAQSACLTGLASLGGDTSTVFDGVADLLSGGLESLVLVVAVPLVRRSRQRAPGCDALRALSCWPGGPRPACVTVHRMPTRALLRDPGELDARVDFEHRATWRRRSHREDSEGPAPSAGQAPLLE